jgi:hypothetical protein
MNIKKNHWSVEQIETMERMVEQAVAERRCPNWKVIGQAVGHSAVASCTRMSDLRIKRRNAAEKARLQAAGIDTAPPVAKKNQPKKPPPAPVMVIAVKRRLPDYASHTVATSTHMLVADAELRARIETQGITAGLLGDPLPGRSALDQRKNACGPGGAGPTGLVKS